MIVDVFAVGENFQGHIHTGNCLVCAPNKVDGLLRLNFSFFVFLFLIVSLRFMCKDYVMDKNIICSGSCFIFVTFNCNQVMR